MSTYIDHETLKRFQNDANAAAGRFMAAPAGEQPEFVLLAVDTGTANGSNSLDVQFFVDLENGVYFDDQFMAGFAEA